MIARATMFTMTMLVAVAMHGAGLSIGPEMLLGSRDLGQSYPLRIRPAIASDGDELFVVSVTEQGSLLADRFDRRGKMLNAEPIPLAIRTIDVSEVAPDVTPRVVWFAGHYVVFYRARWGLMYALRTTREGEVVDRVRLHDVSGWYHFDAATDGNELVFLDSGVKVLRLGSDLRVLDTIVLQTVPTNTRTSGGIAYGGGRFAIVVTDRKEATSWFLENGILSTPVRVGQANNSGYTPGPTRVAWTGTKFVTAWTECSEEDACLSVWTPLTTAGAAAGPLHALEYIFDSFIENLYGVTITVLDEETVFFTWEASYLGKARGRRFRLSGEPVGDVVTVGQAPVAGFRTTSGSLFVLDSTLSAMMIDAPTVAPLADPLPLAPAGLKMANEKLLAAAVTAGEIATVRSRWRGQSPWTDDAAVLGIMARDGSNVREVPVSARSAALASDGREFYVLLSEDNYGGVWFQRAEASAKRFRLDQGRSYAAEDLSLVWTGMHFVALWREAGRVFLAYIDREGKLVANETVLSETIGGPCLIYRANGMLLMGFGGRMLSLDASGQIQDSTQLTLFGSPPGQLALATDGETDAFAATVDGYANIAVGFRQSNEPFTYTAPLFKQRKYSVQRPQIAVTRSGFVVSYLFSRSWYSIETAFVDRNGVLRDIDLLAHGAYESATLLEMAPDVVLALYTRNADEPPYGGVSRVFARVIKVGDTDELRRSARR